MASCIYVHLFCIDHVNVKHHFYVKSWCVDHGLFLRAFVAWFGWNLIFLWFVVRGSSDYYRYLLIFKVFIGSKLKWSGSFSLLNRSFGHEYFQNINWVFTEVVTIENLMVFRILVGLHLYQLCFRSEILVGIVIQWRGCWLL